MTTKTSTILLVEDEFLIAAAEAETLRGFGYAVATAGSGEKAIAAMLSMPDIGLVLMDIDLGRGISGPETAQKILADRTIPIVFLTSHAEREMVETVRGITRYGYVIKNSGNFVLRNAIEMAFELFDANERLRIQHDLGLALNACTNIRQAFDCIMAVVKRYEGIESGGVYMAESEADTLELAAYDGWSPTFADSVRCVPATSPHIGMESREIVRYADGDALRTKADADIAAEGWRSLAVIPIVANGRLVAVLKLTSHTHNSIPAATRAVLDNLAVQLGNVLTRIRSDALIRESEDKFSKAFKASPEATTIASMDSGRYVEVNDIFLKKTGYRREEVIGRTSTELNVWVDQDDRRKYISALQADGSLRDMELAFRMRSGEIRFFSVSSETILLGGLKYSINFIFDITERKKVKRDTETLLAEKELLLSEIQHRIKNSMNTIAGLLTLQIAALSDPAAVNAVREAKSRVDSIRFLYDKLYRSNDVGKISIRQYLSPLVDEIVSNFPNRAAVAVEKRIDDFAVDAKLLQPIGLIVNELLTNIMKYAFPDGAKGTLSIAISAAGDHAIVVIADDGVGLPADINFQNTTGFGLTLVRMLALQLNGSVRFEPGSGTKVVLEFNL